MDRLKKYPERAAKGRYLPAMAVLLLLAPLAGVAWLDQPIARYLEFPPRTKYIVHASFSWPVFTLLLLFVAAVCLPFLLRFIAFGSNRKRTAENRDRLPWWGWSGAVLVLVFWVITWNRFSFFAAVQPYTFSPLWLGYILVVNALTYRRAGTCLLCSQPRFFLALFPASTFFWWYFEYLNRFVQNWYYIGGKTISSLEYVVHASICFSTVLPAVLSTSTFLGTFPRLTGAFSRWHPIEFRFGRWAGQLLLVLAVVPLTALAVFPDYLFPLLWISPLFAIVGTQLAGGNNSLVTDLKQGNWQYIVIPALAALLCGFFWEMWNWKSLAHWEYSIPFVNRFHVFAMPLLGYAGYLPFGVVCTEAAALIIKKIP